MQIQQRDCYVSMCCLPSNLNFAYEENTEGLQIHRKTTAKCLQPPPTHQCLSALTLSEDSGFPFAFFGHSFSLLLAERGLLKWHLAPLQILSAFSCLLPSSSAWLTANEFCRFTISLMCRLENVILATQVPLVVNFYLLYKWDRLIHSFLSHDNSITQLLCSIWQFLLANRWFTLRGNLQRYRDLIKSIGVCRLT